MTYDDLLIEADSKNLKVKEKSLEGNDGRIYNNCIAIRESIPTLKEKSCVLAEELGHYHTSTGNIINQDDSNSRRQEYIARLWGYNKKVGLKGIIEAYKAGCESFEELAEYLDTTEEYLYNVFECYHSKYGICVTVGNYVIYFEPVFTIGELDEI